MVSSKLVLLCVTVFVVATASALPQRQTGRSRSAQVKQEEVGHILFHLNFVLSLNICMSLR